MALIIRSSAIHAAGCYTTTPIRKGSRVAEYTGHMLTKKEADKRYKDSPVTYLFGLGDGSMVIDGHSATMFINHSCDSNCETEEIDGRVYIMAIRHIQAGEEITYDYCLYDGGDDDANCNCGSEHCRLTMYSPQEMKTRRKKARLNKKKARLNGKKPAGKSKPASKRQR
jgi:SET domain-containing protein